jgi:hypothetical protein
MSPHAKFRITIEAYGQKVTWKARTGLPNGEGPPDEEKLERVAHGLCEEIRYKFKDEVWLASLLKKLNFEKAKEKFWNDMRKWLGPEFLPKERLK